MSDNVDGLEVPLRIAPLRRLKPNGELYRRPPEIEASLNTLAILPLSELTQRVRNEDPDDPNYVQSECVLYFLRQPNVAGDGELFQTLFKVLRQRVYGATPVPSRPIPGSTRRAESLEDLEIREKVLQRFQEQLCSDRKDYGVRLDCFECRFNFAVARLRATARRDVRKLDARYEAMDFESNLAEPSSAVETALSRLSNPSGGTDFDFLYRSKLLAAISSLPPDQRQVIELILQGFPIDSKDDGVRTIKKIIGCSAEKTVRNIRDRAYLAIENALKEEEDS